MRRVIIILGLLILALVAGFGLFKKEESKEEPILMEGREISLEEKQQIEAWIKENDLNQYGDPKATVYMGGTPLFDEKTGKRMDKYEYILRNHPDRPWVIK